MQGRSRTIRSGGTVVPAASAFRAAAECRASAFYSGMVEVGADGKAEVASTSRLFDGTLRVMAAAWNADKLGHAVRT